MEVEDNIQLIGENQVCKALTSDCYVAKVSFDNDNEPVYLLSKKELSKSDYLNYVKSMGLEADIQYRIFLFSPIEL